MRWLECREWNRKILKSTKIKTFEIKTRAMGYIAMQLSGHGNQKYLASEQFADLSTFPDFRIERRLIQAGPQAEITLKCTEIAVVLAGRSSVQRTGNGDRQTLYAQPGSVWICPIGTHEQDIELSDPIECLHIYLPQTLIGEQSLADYDVDPSRVELAYAGGFADPMIQQISAAFAGLLARSFEATDRIFADGMRVALAAHLISNYTVDRWTPPTRTPTLDRKRLKKIIDHIDAHLADNLSLESLAIEACLSPFHFSRLFREATGLPPHRYVTDRRVQVAQAQLQRDDQALVQIALDTGFGSQNNFTRVFRKATGLTPGQYRDLCRRAI
jgi:AraC family transcriptional regulator